VSTTNFEPENAPVIYPAGGRGNKKGVNKLYEPGLGVALRAEKEGKPGPLITRGTDEPEAAATGG